MKFFVGIFQFLFGCRHRHLSRVFTIRQRNYKVCFDCAKEFEVPDADGPIRSAASPGAQRGTNPFLQVNASRF